MKITQAMVDAATEALTGDGVPDPDYADDARLMIAAVAPLILEEAREMLADSARAEREKGDDHGEFWFYEAAMAVDALKDEETQEIAATPKDGGGRVRQETPRRAPEAARAESSAGQYLPTPWDHIAKA